MHSSPERRLRSYMVTGDSGESVLVRQVERALARGVDLVQLRRKRDSALRLQSLALRLAALRPRAGARLLVNERLDVALAAGAAGVHLPAEGLPVSAVRGRLPRGFLVAASTHDAGEAERAAREGADFIVFGPVFATPSKPGHPGTGLEVFARVASSVPVPVFAIGGVTPERCRVLAEAGAAGVAGISAFEREESLEALLASLEGAFR